MSVARIPDPYSALDLEQPIRLMVAREADAVAVRVNGLLTRLTVPIAHEARVIVDGKLWKRSGWALARDWSRNVLSRDERWLRLNAALGRALVRWPRLADALTGDDGQPAIGLVAAVELARVADDMSLPAWISLARSVGVRALKDAVRRALEAGSTVPLPGDSVPAAQETEERATVTLHLNVAPQLLPAWAAARELHDAISGHRTAVGDFVEALVADFEAGLDGPVEDAGPYRWGASGSRLSTEDREREAENRAAEDGALEDQRSRDEWLHAMESTELDELERHARATLHRIREGGAGSRMQDLLRAEELCRVLLGQLLARLAELRAWRELGYANLGHYAEGRLGICRTTACKLARIARECRGIPELADEYENGLLGPEKVLLVLERFRGDLRNPNWGDGLGGVIESVRWQTCRRAADENSVWARARAGRRRGVPDAIAKSEGDGASRCGRSLSDSEWQASLRREPRAAYAEILELADDAVKHPSFIERFELRLDAALAGRFMACLEAAQRQIAGMPMFSAGSPSYTGSFGLFAMLISYASEWDPPAGRHPEDRPTIYRRDGYRCTAPGCTNTTGLHRHHVRYRSRGGDDSDANQTTLCAFHHQDGEHGGLMSVEGEAPLGLVFRLGPPERGMWYRNDVRMRRRP